MSDILRRFAERFDPRLVAEGAFAEPDDILLFVHVPKTAGVSVGASLRDAFDVFHAVDWNKTQQSFVECARAALNARQQKPLRQVLMGHFGDAQLRFWQTHGLAVKAAAVIREPVARVVSNYNYNTSDRHPAREQFTARFPTLADYVESIPPDFQLNFMLGIFRDFDHALERLTEDFSFLGVTEQLDASLAHLARSHGLKRLKTHRKNTAPRSAETQIDAKLRRVILDKSANDLRLHELLMGYYR